MSRIGSLLLYALAFGEAAASTAQPVTHMSDDLRESITSIVILPVRGQSGESITGTYGRETPGLAGGMQQGGGIGQVPVEVGQVPINIPIPILREIGMLVGGISGAVKERTQDLRDRMTEDLASEVEQPLSNISLATDVFWGLRGNRSLDPKLFAETTPIPPDTDAILYVHLDQVTLNIQEDEAIVSTVAVARVQSQADGATLYRTTASYSDRDLLKNWALDDYALWQEYRQFARHYLSRELVAELYDRIIVSSSLQPDYGSSVKRDGKNAWRGQTKSLLPTLAWAFDLTDSDQRAAGAAIRWDVEIYDAARPVLRAQDLPDTRFQVDMPLEACKSYRWSVRPTYVKDGRKFHGSWMRKGAQTAAGNGNVGRAVSVAHAYIQDFASLEVDCRAR